MGCGNGYDHTLLKENDHPDRLLLDKISDTHPIALQHKSGHFGVFNTKALEILNVTAETKPPQGGVIHFENSQPTGFMEETAFIDYIKKVPQPDPHSLLSACKKAQDKYASYGITTVQEGMFSSMMIPLYTTLAKQNILYLDVVGYMDAADYSKTMQEFENNIGKYKNHFKINGFKIFLDGSPQGRTAWMRQPYKRIKQTDDANYCGNGVLTDEQVFQRVKIAYDNNLQIIAHCNGDKACDQYISALEKLQNATNYTTDFKPVMIHAQFLGVDQIQRVKSLGIIPSFFVAHVYHWGDIHIKNFGFETASQISPLATATQNDIPFTLHTDSPVIEPNLLESVWCAVTRKTKQGVHLGETQSISVYDALLAITKNVAIQYGEQDKKGTIEIGKNADFVILDSNPLTVKPDDILNIKILATIKDGKSVFVSD